MSIKSSTWSNNIVCNLVNNKSRYLIAFILIFLLLFSTANLFAHQEREDCSICGMWIDLYMKTRHVVTLNNGITESFCSISCASKYIKKHHNDIKAIMAGNYITSELIDAYKAFYLSGSDVQGVMTYTSRIAFPSMTMAIEFQKEHGGKIISFDQALKELDEE